LAIFESVSFPPATIAVMRPQRLLEGAARAERLDHGRNLVAVTDDLRSILRAERRVKREGAVDLLGAVGGGGADLALFLDQHAVARVLAAAAQPVELQPALSVRGTAGDQTASRVSIAGKSLYGHLASTTLSRPVRSGVIVTASKPRSPRRAA
jgi:hypothetical protein